MDTITSEPTSEPTWEPPGPGPWQQDSAHNPVSQTRLMQDIYPAGFNRGFEEAFAGYGVLLDVLAMGVVNGFTYHQPQPFDLPGPDGPKDPEWIGAEIGRRADVAARAMSERIWRDAIREWDDEAKPASQARHRRLGSVDLASLDDEALLAHVHTCLENVEAMVYQHHRNNCHALVPVGDFLLQTAAWTKRDPLSLYGVLDGYSPVSNVLSPDVQPAVAAVRADEAALELLMSAGDAADVLDELRRRIPEVDDLAANVHFRVIEGFDIDNPTIGERPDCIVGRLRAAVGMHGSPATDRADAPRSQYARTSPPSTKTSSTTCSPRHVSCTACATSAASTATSPRSGFSVSQCSNSGGDWWPAAGSTIRRRLSKSASPRSIRSSPDPPRRPPRNSNSDDGRGADSPSKVRRDSSGRRPRHLPRWRCFRRRSHA